jgi:D-inositol-3-phosphate glycosyltransferase
MREKQKSNSIKVFLLEPQGRGGNCHYSFCLARSLHQKNYRVTVVTQSPYELRSISHAHDVREFRFRRLRGIFKSLCYIWHGRPDVVHYQGTNNYPLFELLFLGAVKRLSRAAIVYTGHQLIPHEGEAQPRRAIRLKLRLCDAVIVHNQRTQIEAVEEYGLRHEAVHVIPHGNFDFFREIDPGCSPFGWKKVPGCIDVLFFGSIQAYKGLPYLIEAIATLHREGKPFRLMVVGKPYQPWESYQQLIKQCGIERVSLIGLGYQDLTAIPPVFRFCDIVCLPHLRLSESGVLQIASAFGKPVVATDVGGNHEAAREGLIAELVPAGDSASLACALERVGSQILEGIPRLMGKVDSDRRDWATIAETTALLYDRLLRSKRN